MVKYKFLKRDMLVKVTEKSSLHRCWVHTYQHVYDCDFLAGGICVQPQVWGRPPAYSEPSICIQIPVIFLWRARWLLGCHLKVVLYPSTARLGCLFFFLSLYLWPAGNRAYLKGTDLAEQPDCLLSPDCKSPHTLHAFPLFMTHWKRIRSVLDWFRLSEPWQSQGIMLRFLSSTTFSKWIPCSKRTTRTSSGGKTRTKLRFCAQRVAQNSPRWSEQ